MAGRAELLRAALRRIFSSLPEEATETEARAIRNAAWNDPAEDVEANWFRRQYERSKRERDLGETADNLGDVQLPELEVPQSPYDDWLAARRRILPEMIDNQRAFDARNVGSDSVESTIKLGKHPVLSHDLPQAIGADLGPYAVGGRLENFPILAVPAAIGGGLTLRELLRNRYAQQQRA